MWRNTGGADRTVRFMIGFALLVAALTTTGSMIWLELGLGLFLITTAIIGFCPFYIAFRINTRN